MNTLPLLALVPIPFLLHGIVAPSPTPHATQAAELKADTWRTDRAWYDGQAEMCVYEATRTIYGIERKYEARAYTNKQMMDPETTTKSSGSEGVEVFKHHWSERVPTEAYDYDFSTATFTRTDDVTPFKLTAATQEDCGASFKQATREGDSLSFFESTYFPGGGVKSGSLGSAAELTFEDALPLVLRNFPFEDAVPKDMGLQLVPSQKHTRTKSWISRPYLVKYAGRKQLNLPTGLVQAHRLDLVDEAGDVDAQYWFSTDGTAPLLHVLVKYYDARTGDTYELKSHKRTAYWERP